MSKIIVEHNPEQVTLNAMGVNDWPIWEKEASTFPWHYDEKETAYILEGEVTVTPSDGKPVSFAAGDLVIFPAGMSCTWEIKKDLSKHYSFG